MQGLPVILKWHIMQSLDKALDLFLEFKFCESDFYFLNGNKNCMVATYNFGLMYMYILLFVCFRVFILHLSRGMRFPTI